MQLYDTYTDQQLITLLQISDEAAFTEIYDRYWDQLFGMAYNRLREIEASEDAVHDVFASLWKTRERAEIKSLKNYLAVSLKYIILRSIYRQQLSKKYIAAQGSVQYIEMKPDEFDFISILSQELDKLPQKCRVIFEYSRIDAMSNKEIAEKMGISVKTVENQINTAQKQLRVALKNSYIFALFFFN